MCDLCIPEAKQGSKRLTTAIGYLHTTVVDETADW